MKAQEFDEHEFFTRIAMSGARVLLIGRRALVVLGLPMLTADYDFWVHPEDIGPFNAALESLGFIPNRSVEEARARGRYALENDEHVDVLVARSVQTVEGETVAFDGVWERRTLIALSETLHLALPGIDDLIATKRFSARPKDVEDIRLLQVLRDTGGGS